jgi:hypothetical protein
MILYVPGVNDDMMMAVRRRVVMGRGFKKFGLGIEKEVLLYVILNHVLECMGVPSGKQRHG